jgi:hypothetical protein
VAGKDPRGAIGAKTNLEVSELRELLAALVKAAKIRLGLLVDDLVGANVSALSESLSTDLTLVWPLACMASLMSLYITVSFQHGLKGVWSNTLRFPS